MDISYPEMQKRVPQARCVRYFDGLGILGLLGLRFRDFGLQDFGFRDFRLQGSGFRDFGL